MELRHIIKQFRDDHNLSQREFAERCNDITHGYISMIENNLNKSTGKPPRPSMDKLESIAGGMGITLERLLDMMNDRPSAPPTIPGIQSIPYKPSQPMVPIIGTVRCGPGGLAFEELQGAAMADVSNPNEYFYLRAEGDSMAPDIKDGDLVLIHQQPEVENGALAVVIIDGEEGTLKRFTRQGDSIILQSLNPAYTPRVIVGEEMNSVIIAGRVMESKRQW